MDTKVHKIGTQTQGKNNVIIPCQQSFKSHSPMIDPNPHITFLQPPPPPQSSKIVLFAWSLKYVCSIAITKVPNIIGTKAPIIGSFEQNI